MTKEEVPCGSKVSGFGGPEGGEGQPSRADLKGEQLAGQGQVARPTSLALSHSNCPLTTTCEHGHGSSAGSCGAARAATASPPSSCLPVCSVLPQHNTVVLASPSQHATNLPQSGICTVALTPITPTVMQPVFVPTIPQLGVPVSLNSVSLPVPGTLLTPTSLSPSTPNSKSVSAGVNGLLLQPPTVITVPSRTFQCQNSHVSNNYQLTHQPTVSPVPNITVSSTSDSISLSLRTLDEKRDLNSLTASQPVVPMTCHVLGQQSHPNFSARGANSIANNTVAAQPRFIISNRIDNEPVLSDQESNSSTLIPNPLPISFSSNSVPGNAGHLVGNSLQVISGGNHVTTSSSIHCNDPNLSQFVQTTPSNGTPHVEQCAVRSEASHLRSNSLPLFNPCSSGSAGLHTSTLPKSPSLPVSGANSDALPGTSRTGSTFRPIRIQRKTGFFFQGQLPPSPNAIPSDQSAEKSCTTRRFKVDLRLTLPPSPPPVESDDVESFYSFQGDETASVRTSDDSSDDSSDDCEPAIRPGIEPAARRDPEGASESWALMLLNHFVMSGREDYDPCTLRMREDYYSSARSSRDNHNPSVVLEQRPVFDEFEPVSDHDQNEPVAQYSDSDIDASFAVAAYAAMSSEIDEFADQSAVDSDAADSDELDMTAFFIARHRREEKRRRSKRDNCDVSSGPSESDPDFNDDRWKCLECNQANNRSFFRYCEKCWKMRRCWLPDPPKKRKKKKPRHRPRKRRSFDKTSKAAGGVQTKAGASDTAGCSTTTQVACSAADDVNAGGRGAAEDTCLEVRRTDTDVQRASGSVRHCSETPGTHLSGESCTRRSESFGTDAVEAKLVASEASTAALRCSSGEGTSGVGGASSAAAERPCNLQMLECVPDVQVSSVCAPRCATEGESLATSAAGASNSKESSDQRSDNLSCEKIQISEEKTQSTEEGAKITAHAAQTCSFIACRKKTKDLVSCPHPEDEVLEPEDPSEDIVDGGAPALARCSSTASTVILDPDETQFTSALQDCTRKLTDPVSDDPVPTNPVSVDPASTVPASDERKLLLGKILSNNLFSSVNNSIDTVGWHNEWPNSSPRSEKSDMGVHDGQHHSTDPGTDLDHCSTASGADSIPSVVDSGLGSSQDLFQESSQDVPAHLPANASSYRSAIVFTSPKKKDAFSTERRRRSNSSSTRIEVIDFVIEEVSDGSPSKRSGDRGRKRKSAMLEAEACKKRKSDTYGPIAAYLNEGLDLIDETTNVQKLPESHAVRIIGETLVQFLRSPDGWDWLSSSKGRSWMSSPPVQAVLHESLRRSTDSAEASSSVFGDNLCIMCQDRPKDAVIIHGKISHQATCYKCAKTICDRKQRCPVCRRKILRIAKNIII